jgi:hypothetical protein
MILGEIQTQRALVVECLRSPADRVSAPLDATIGVEPATLVSTLGPNEEDNIRPTSGSPRRVGLAPEQAFLSFRLCVSLNHLQIPFELRG